MSIQVKALVHIRPMNGGGSQSQLFKADDGRAYVTKLIGNPQGTRILANEFVVGRMAQILGVPTPPVGVIEVEEFMVNQLNPTLGTSFKPGLAFASLYLGSENIEVIPSNLEIMQLAVNRTYWPNVVVLNSLVQNDDRKDAHVLITRNRSNGELQFWAVDHGHCFGVTQGWSKLSLDNASLRLGPYQELLSGDNSYEDALTRLRSLDRGTMEAILSDCPCSEWEMSKEDKEGLIWYLEEAGKKIANIIKPP